MFFLTFLTLFTTIHAGLITGTFEQDSEIVSGFDSSYSISGEYGSQGASFSIGEYGGQSASSSLVEYGGILSSSSHSGEYGGPGGLRFSHSTNQLDGPITAIRVRINPVNIVGIQFRYGTKWSQYKGGFTGSEQEIFLHPGESIIQVTGKYHLYVKQLIFITDQHREFSFGHGIGTSFNAVPLHSGTVLRFISGRALLVLDAISFHWGTYYSGFSPNGHPEG
ncbi:zymogen granule membrane protein 16-like [Sceloporus undulatus]|uniref:zymogen granule membrane protein 16-like n=1 Tax=Sceloporus undulatus TaxID=8520 RepID=UPI001C4BD584|nr:zymogen granule membrane protein 16-like [Sceloporus undulatus]